MTFNTVPGKLYIIGEQDVFGGSSSPYFKVGIVKDDREVESRLREHQTGNPRKLVIRDLVDVAAVEYLETNLHRRLATKVAFSEWFKLSDEDYADLLKLARDLSDDVARQVPLAQRATELKDLVSNGVIIPADGDVWQLHTELYPETVKAKKFAGSISAVNTAVRSRVTDTETPVIGQRQIEVETSKFNAEAFVQEHPELAEKFQKITVNGRFTPKKIKDIDTELESFDPLKTVLSVSLYDLERMGEKELEQARRVLTEVEAKSAWSETHHGVAIRSAIGENDGIENVASWKRTSKSTLDQTRLKREESAIYEKFVEKVRVTRWVNVNQGLEDASEEQGDES